MMTTHFKRRYAGLIGLGFMYIWGSAFWPWMRIYQSDHISATIIGFFGMSLVSICGLAVFLYVGELQDEVRLLSDQLHSAETSAEDWQHQAQMVIRLLQREREGTESKQGEKMETKHHEKI